MRQQKDFKKMNRTSVNCEVTSRGLIQECVTGVLKGRRADTISEEVMFPNFPNLMKTINQQIQED